MFKYYLQLGVRSLRRNPVLTALMVFGIALGVGASMTTLTVFYLMGSDPIPWKSGRLHYVQLDNWDADDAYNSTDGEPPLMLTYRDALALVGAGKADRQAAMYRIRLPVQPENATVKPFTETGRATGADFFAMFEPPFTYGDAWSREQDTQHARVIVINDTLNEKLFGGSNSVGESVRINDTEYLIVGVLAPWHPRIKFYDLWSGKLSAPERFYVPFTTAAELKASLGRQDKPLLDSEELWVDVWTELDSSAALKQYKSFLDDYVGEQKKLGRFARPLNNRLYDVLELMKVRHVVSSDVRVQSGLSLAFLLVCLLNTVGLLLAKFMHKSGEIGVRRALGASRRQLFQQHLVEAGVIGASGGALGLALTGLGLWSVRLLYPGFTNVARLDWLLVLATIALAIVASLAAGLYPVMRACRIEPAIQIKVQ
jgi:putative ABC transport system permease protein